MTTIHQCFMFQGYLQPVNIKGITSHTNYLKTTSQRCIYIRLVEEQFTHYNMIPRYSSPSHHASSCKKKVMKNLHADNWFSMQFCLDMPKAKGSKNLDT
uniref:Uncharacterized protein n=1 Tax=Arundo donax TaxID=35708 RepID=A0A0A9GE58_ARUDO